jgi:anti-sigma factor RsiW
VRVPMAQTPRKTGHRFEEALGYVQDFLPADEKTAFEEHLATCAECQASVATARQFVPALNAALRAPSPLTDAQLLANARREAEARAEEKAEGAWLFRNWGKIALVLTAAAAVALLWPRSFEPAPGHSYAPAPPERHAPDAGDGG